MNPYVIQILAMGLTISQLFTKPVGEFRTHFNEKGDQPVVKGLIHDGCRLVLKTFQAENVNVDDLWKPFVAAQAAPTTPDDDGDETQAPSATPGQPKGPAGLQALGAKFDAPTMYVAFQSICQNRAIDASAIHLDEVITYFNETMKNLPDHRTLKNFRFKEASVLKDGAGQTFTEIYEDQNRRRFVALKDLPPHVAQAFVSAEDKGFYQHKGLDLNGIVRAFVSGLTAPEGKRPPGGSTITQQVMKNVLLDSSLNLQRKMREMVLAARTEQLLSKHEILELYLNYVFLGRSSWGIDMAARSYFGKSAVELTVSEAAFLAGLNKGPNYYNPDTRPTEVEARRQYVLKRMREDKPELAADVDAVVRTPPKFIAGFQPPRRRGGFYFVDEIQRQAKALAGIKSLSEGSYVIRSTMDVDLQRLAEKTLQDGLANYEASTGRATFQGAVGSLANEINTYKKEWTEVIQHIRSKYYDVQWPVATLLQAPATSGGRVRVGLQDGTQAWLDYGKHNLSKLRQWDLVHVNLATAPKSGRVQLKVPPRVQGAIVIMEAKTGRVLALTGGFSYPASQLNRATQMVRQAGSTLKPFAYVYALDQGLQPNTLVPNQAQTITLPGRPPWAPVNYNRSVSAPVTMTYALEQSLNVAAVNLVAMVNGSPADGLAGVCNVTRDVGVYDKCENETFPFVLGAKATRLLDMAVGYATIANLGLKPTPYVFDTIVQGDRELWRRPFARLHPAVKSSRDPNPTINDQASFYQVRRMMEGVVSRGTALAFKDLSGYVAGKTGTSNDWNDAWFVGFTNDVVVATWVGYDNANQKERRTLGREQTGSQVALPIGGQILRYLVHRNPVPLAPPPADARLAEVPVDRLTGQVGRGNVSLPLRLDQSGQPLDTQFRLVPHESLYGGVGQVTGDGDGGEAVTNDGYAPERAFESPAESHYRPGQDDQYQLWRDQNRNVDPYYNYGFGR